MKLTPDFIAGIMASLVGAVVGAVIGALLVAGWDLWKDARRRAEEKQKAARLLRGEFVTNIVFLERNKEHLLKDIEVAKERKEVVVPLASLSTRAWEAVQLAGALPEFSEELEQTYAAVSILNQRIQARELYRATSQAMSNYDQRRTLINQDLLTAVEKLLEEFQKHRQALH